MEEADESKSEGDGDEWMWVLSGCESSIPPHCCQNPALLRHPSPGKVLDVDIGDIGGL